MQSDESTPDEYDVLWPAVLYVDAFNRGAEVQIGALLDEMGIAYDRYDYTGSASSWAGSMARSHGGTTYNPAAGATMAARSINSSDIV